MTAMPAADDLRDLQRSEHLVLFGFRLMAFGHGDCPALRRAYCSFLGGDGDRALGGLMAFTRMIGWVGRRKVRLHAPGCCALSADERCVIAVVAAAQASLCEGESVFLRDRFEALLGAPADEACLMAAQSIAAVLTCHGLPLPERDDTRAAKPRPLGATLH